jgi:acetyltransferase-like isoleucine patch superfamily enzyme
VAAPSRPYHLEVDIERLSVGGKLSLYLRTVSTSGPRLLLEQAIFLLASWVPTVVGVGLRALLYPLIVRARWPLVTEKNVTLHRPGRMRFGANVYLSENVYILAGGDGVEIGDYSELLPNVVLMIRDYRGVSGARIEIGRRCSFNAGVVVFSHGRTRIGDHVQIGPGAVISTTDHFFADPTQPVRTQGLDVRDVTIEDGACIGARAVILPGVTVGRGAVVGAGAVVWDDVPPYTMVLGMPARVVKSWDPGRVGGTTAERG